MTFHYDDILENKRPTILLLDDDPIAHRLLVPKLKEMFDVNIISSLSSNESLKYLENHLVDLIIQDVIRPELDGWNFLHIIREDKRLKEIPVLFITTMGTDKAFIDKAESLNAKYISKPVHLKNRDQFRERIINLIPVLRNT